MKATIESTTEIVDVTQDGRVKARVWEGKTERGVPFVAYIVFVQSKSADDNAEFVRDLLECKVPTPETLKAIDARMIL